MMTLGCRHCDCLVPNDPSGSLYNMTTATNWFGTYAASSILQDHGGYDVDHIDGDRIYLTVPASSLNAADWLRSEGIDATARSSGGWHVQVMTEEGKGL